MYGIENTKSLLSIRHIISMLMWSIEKERNLFFLSAIEVAVIAQDENDKMMLLVHDKGIDVVDLRPNSLKIIAKHSTKSGGNRFRPSKRKVNFRWMKFLSKHFSHMRKIYFWQMAKTTASGCFFLHQYFVIYFACYFFLSDPHLFAIYIFLTICCLSMTACVCFDVYVCGFCLKFVFMKPLDSLDEWNKSQCNQPPTNVHTEKVHEESEKQMSFFYLVLFLDSIWLSCGVVCT